MRLTEFQVTKFRNIVDSGPIAVNPSVTCLVGKNEAGKSGLIEALYLLNPAYVEEPDVEDQYPRWLVAADRRKGDLGEHAPISATFSFEEDDYDAVHDLLGKEVLTGKTVTIRRRYNGETIWNLEWSKQTVLKNAIARFPKPVAVLCSESTTLDNLRKTLEGLAAGEGEADPRPEDIQAAKKWLEECGLHKNDSWDPVVEILTARLPQFFRFTNYSTLPGRIDFRELAPNDEDGPATSDLQAARALLKLAGTDLNLLGKNDYELRKGELEAVQIDLTNQVFEFWKQNPHLEVLIDVDKETVPAGPNQTAVSRFLDIRLKDRRTGYSNNFSQRSSGFQWFFSFLAAFSEFEDEEAPIVLLDEPALTLHGKAQADFLRFINERLAPNSPVLYTTHSPFMVERGRLDRVRVVEDLGPPKGAVANDDVFASDPDSLFPLQAALGYDIAQHLFVGPHNLVVEGASEYIYLTIMSAACEVSDRDTIDERWRILPAGGATNIPTFVSLVGPHLDVTVLADSNTKGMQRFNNMIERKLLAGHRLVLASVATPAGHADIEDLFSEGDYLKLYNKTYNATIKVSDLPAGDRIVKRIEAVIGKTFLHGKVAETVLRHRQDLSFTDTTLDRFGQLNRALNATMET